MNKYFHAGLREAEVSQEQGGGRGAKLWNGFCLRFGRQSNCLGGICQSEALMALDFLKDATNIVLVGPNGGR